jgi:CheY-like chemotaxis protein
VTSKLGSGSTFAIRFPCQPDAQAPARPLPTPATLPRGTERILLVEDETAVRDLVEVQLKSLGYGVISAADPQQALALLDELDVPPAVVLTDLVMPGMGGRELAELIEQEYPGLPVRFMSGFDADNAFHQRTLPDGVELLHKPFTRAQLAHTVREALDSRG